MRRALGFFQDRFSSTRPIGDGFGRRFVAVVTKVSAAAHLPLRFDPTPSGSDGILHLYQHGEPDQQSGDGDGTDPVRRNLWNVPV